MGENCDLCRLIDGETTDKIQVVLRNPELLVALRTNGDHPGDWLTVIPTRHASALVDLSQSERDILSPIVATLDAILAERYYSLNHAIVSHKTTSGHVSVHLIPVGVSLNITDFINLAVSAY